LIVKSANDCAVVLAEHLGKTEENFAKIMTKTAKELGMKHTTFKNASGLHHSQQKTTARDMAILGSAIYHHFPEYYDLFSTKNFTYNGKTYKTHNHLLKNYTGADGMKTGYTYLAGYNIVTSAQRNNNRVIAVTMGHNSIKNRDYKVAQLMNTGFSKLNNSYQYRAIANLDITQTTSDLLTSDNQNNLWGIQVGAFSNYAKARSYALGIQNQLKPDYASKTSVHVEPFSKGYTVVYRSQLIGLKKNEADKSCNQLKHKNKSCMVVSIEQKTQFAMANQ
jgi:D-alanyl-D-alanine carboxypeptidase